MCHSEDVDPPPRGPPAAARSEGVASAGPLRDVDAMADAIKRLNLIAPHRCRESASQRFDVTAVAGAHETAHAR